ASVKQNQYWPVARRNLRRGAPGFGLAMLAGLILSLAAVTPSSAQEEGVDTALVIAVDVSNSVDENRYRLQMEGIASALEDPSVVRTILNGPRSSILVSLITWADRAEVAVPWMRIGSEDDARRGAQAVRSLPHATGEFTCMGMMRRFVDDKIVPQVPVHALRRGVDVSGDGADNGNGEVPVRAVRDEMAGYGTTVNGLPSLEGREVATVEDWSRDNVKA